MGKKAPGPAAFPAEWALPACSPSPSGGRVPLPRQGQARIGPPVAAARLQCQGVRCDRGAGVSRAPCALAGLTSCFLCPKDWESLLCAHQQICASAPRLWTPSSPLQSTSFLYQLSECVLVLPSHLLKTLDLLCGHVCAIENGDWTRPGWRLFYSDGAWHNSLVVAVASKSRGWFM